jgi:hypothetical protein
MSMNIMITASRKVTFKKKNGKRGGGIQSGEFRALQTPTQVTYDILASKDPAQTYIDWVLRDCSRDEVVAVFAPEDIWEEDKPVGTRVWNHGKEHVEEFRAWIKDVEENGFTVKYEMI